MGKGAWDDTVCECYRKRCTARGTTQCESNTKGVQQEGRHSVRVLQQKVYSERDDT